MVGQNQEPNRDIQNGEKLPGLYRGRTGAEAKKEEIKKGIEMKYPYYCLLYTSPSPRDATLSRMPSSA